jgi:hypothetical protein
VQKPSDETNGYAAYAFNRCTARSGGRGQPGIQACHCGLARDADPSKPFQVTMDRCQGRVRGELDSLAEVGPDKGPGLLRKAINLACAVTHHVASGRPAAPPDAQAARLAICRKNRCGYYSGADRCLHQSCGCFLSVKTG